MDDLPSLVAGGTTATVEGQWQRHVSIAQAAQALEGRIGYGRWGTADGFRVLYLGSPRNSVIVEAYRHLVDTLEESDELTQRLSRQLAPRVLVTCQVFVTNVLDLRQARTRVELGVALSDLRSPTDDTDAYSRCQQIAQVAHQLGRHGILAPAATAIGETLALFPDQLPPAELPVRNDDEIWQTLPPDPRLRGSSLRVVSD